MSRVRRFSLAPDAEVDQFLTGLGQRTTLEAEPTEVVERTIYDTFDWRLHNDGSVIERQVRDGEAIVVWRSLRTGDTLARFAGDEGPRLATDLEPGPATERLAAILDMRALIALSTVNTRRTTMRQLDDEHKTIARVIADEVVDPGDHPLRSVIQVVPLRGYDDEASELTDLLDAQVVLTPDAEDLMVAALRRDGFAPGDYTSKLRMRLDPDQGGADAYLVVLRALFAAMLANEPGTRDDLDSEFLHDFRVAVRRTRSVLGEANHVLPADVLDTFRSGFKWLGQATGPTRDLDVFLLDTADFAKELPGERRPDLAAFSSFLATRQAEAHAALVADLDRDRYAALVDGWARFLDDPPTPTAEEPDGSRPAPQVAAHRIAKAHRRLIKLGRRIDDGSEPERLHDLRKDAKRLRYLLECFGSLFPSDEIAPIVKDLKGVQDVLGTYQDCQVQAGQLEQFAQDMLDHRNVPASAVMVIGLLVEQLDRRGASARAGFHDRFEAFDRTAVRHAVHRLDPDHPHHAGGAGDGDGDTDGDGGTDPSATDDPHPRSPLEPDHPEEPTP